MVLATMSGLAAAWEGEKETWPFDKKYKPTCDNKYVFSQFLQILLYYMKIIFPLSLLY